jgi:hypothetical protein
MVVTVSPVDQGSKEETFTTLASDFGFDDKVKRLFLEGRMETLEDFRFYFTDEKEIDIFVAAEKSLVGAEQKLQIARVRRAWAAVRQSGLRKENRNTVSSVAELDDLLEESTLRDVKVNFWKRYKAKYPVEVTPSDQLLSRCYREMDKRLLTVYDVWKVKTLLHQVTSTKKRKQVGTDLYTFEDDADATVGTRGVEKYLATLHTYLLALSIAGSNKMEGAPPEEAFGNDATKFVKVPWDVLQSYYFRASRSAMLVPEVSRLQWLEERDIAERSVWVSQFREGDESLGQVVLSVMDKRGAHWDTPIQTMMTRAAPAFPPQHPARPDARAQQQGQQQRRQQPPRQNKQPPRQNTGASQPPMGGGVKMPPGTSATALRDGKSLCPDFNRGACATKGASCVKGLHKCSKVLRNGRPCGMSYHGAHNCRNP